LELRKDGADNRAPFFLVDRAAGKPQSAEGRRPRLSSRWIFRRLCRPFCADVPTS